MHRTEASVYIKLGQSVLLVRQNMILSVRARNKYFIIFSRVFTFSSIYITTLVIWAKMVLKFSGK